MNMPHPAAAATAVAAVVVASVLVACSANPDQSAGGTGSRTTSSSEPSSTPSTPPPSTSGFGGLPLGLHPVSKDIGTGVQIKVMVEAPNWVGEANGGLMCLIECEDPGRGAAVIAFNDRKYFPYRNPCRWSSTAPSSPVTTAGKLVAILARQELRNASQPEAITVDGHSGKKVILRMAAGDLAFKAGDFPDCDNAHFALFGVAGENPARWSQKPGQIEEVWAVDVDGVIAVLIGLYFPTTPQEDVDEMRTLLGSMTFDS
jgi:hypothetical protein